jgi:hypothetical protein
LSATGRLARSLPLGDDEGELLSRETTSDQSQSRKRSTRSLPDNRKCLTPIIEETPIMTPKYAVKFVGDMATVLALENPRQKPDGSVSFDETMVGILNFMTDQNQRTTTIGVSVYTKRGWITVPTLADLASFVINLPNLASRLVAGEDHVHGKNQMRIAPGTNVRDFIQQIISRHSEIAAVLAQAENIALQIKRRPHAAYMDELEKTGLGRVTVHGVAWFVDGKLDFHPDGRVSFVKQTGPGLFNVRTIEDPPKGRG